MDLDEMLRVDRRRDMDELINFWAGSGYSPDAGTRLLSPLSYKRSYAEFYSLTSRPSSMRVGDSGILRPENPTYMYWPLQRRVVLQ